MIIALTGTPGTGKSAVGSLLSTQGKKVVEIGDLAREHGLLKEKDELRGSFEIDPEELQEVVRSFDRQGVLFLVGHLSHLVDADIVIVLRCRPSVLRSRLERRGWGSQKVRENIEAEALDVILVESVETNERVYEIDTTAMPVDMVAAAVLEIVDGKIDKYVTGNIDWSEELLQWY